MSLQRMWAALAPNLTRTLGATAAHPDRGERIILLRPSTLMDVAGDAAPRDLRLAIGAEAGAESVLLELPTQGRLAGQLLAGAKLTIGGADYAVAAPAEALDELIEVPIAPPLAASAAPAAAVIVSGEARYTFEDCHVARKLRRNIGQTLEADSMATIVVPCAGAPTTPRMGDQVQLEDQTVGRVANQVITTGAFWRLQIGT